jgi:pimeloyl-ACP methyl ester carboxylesterase
MDLKPDRYARLLLSVVCGLGAAFFGLWICIGPTADGKVAAIGAMALCVVPPAWMWGASRRVKQGVLAVLVVCVLGVFARAPSMAPPPGPLTSTLLGTGWAFRTVIPRLIPEADELYFGTLLTPILHITTAESAVRLRGLEMEISRRMEEDPRFGALAPASEMTIADILSLPFNNGHAFEYVPPHRDGERLPVVIFLHGSFGNFKTYLWIMKQLADRERCIIVQPSFGMGNWSRRGGPELIERARIHAIQDLHGDPARIFLVGLSAGGLGVTRAGRAHPEAYAALGYISGVLEESILVGRRFADGWRGRNVLVLYGTQDDRIAADGTRAMARSLREEGVVVSEKEYPKEDHYLILSQPDDVVEQLAGWMQRTGEAAHHAR